MRLLRLADEFARTLVLVFQRRFQFTLPLVDLFDGVQEPLPAQVCRPYGAVMARSRVGLTG